MIDRCLNSREGVTVLEKGNFTEEGAGGVLLSWRTPFFAVEKSVLTSSSGVGGHTSLEEGCILISRRGSTSSRVGNH